MFDPTVRGNGAGSIMQTHKVSFSQIQVFVNELLSLNLKLVYSALLNLYQIRSLK